MLDPGANKNTTYYVRNEGNTILSLDLKTSNGRPRTAFKVGTINWDYDAQPLNPVETIQISLTLSVSDRTDRTNFCVDITTIVSQ
jgi:hypothetical protein